MSLGVELGLGPGDFVLDRDPARLPKRGAEPPNFRAMFIWPNGWMDEAGTRHRGRPDPGDFMLDGDPAPSPKRGRIPHPHYSAHFYSGQTAACIKMPLGVELGLGPGDFVLDGDPAVNDSCRFKRVIFIQGPRYTPGSRYT